MGPYVTAKAFLFSGSATPAITVQKESVDQVEPRVVVRSFEHQWAQQDLNLRPSDYESAALTN